MFGVVSHAQVTRCDNEGQSITLVQTEISPHLNGGITLRFCPDIQGPQMMITKGFP